MQSLLSQGANPNLVTEKGVAAVHLAVGKESEKGIRCLKLILQHGADPNLRLVPNLVCMPTTDFGNGVLQVYLKFFFYSFLGFSLCRLLTRYKHYIAFTFNIFFLFKRFSGSLLIVALGKLATQQLQNVFP